MLLSAFPQKSVHSPLPLAAGNILSSLWQYTPAIHPASVPCHPKNVPHQYKCSKGIWKYIVESVKRMERFISSAFIINDTHMMCQSGRIPKRIQVLCDALLLHPVLVLRKSRIVVSGMEMGGFAHSAKKYVKSVLREIHDTVHEMARDEARHGKAFEGLMNRYFG